MRTAQYRPLHGMLPGQMPCGARPRVLPCTACAQRLQQHVEWTGNSCAPHACGILAAECCSGGRSQLSSSSLGHWLLCRGMQAGLRCPCVTFSSFAAGFVVLRRGALPVEPQILCRCMRRFARSFAWHSTPCVVKNQSSTLALNKGVISSRARATCNYAAQCVHVRGARGNGIHGDGT